jgi:superfamily II DNA or RNA helicase
LYPPDRACVALRIKLKNSLTLRPQNAEAGTIQALGAILTDLVLAMEFKHKKWGKKASTRESGAFFRNEVYAPLSLQEQSNGLAAKRWLSVFSLLTVKASILLRMSESGSDDSFEVELFFRPTKNLRVGAYSGQDFKTNMSLVGKETGSLLNLKAAGWLTPEQYMKLGSDQSSDTLKFLVALKEYIPQIRALLKDGRAQISAEMFELFILEKAGILQALGVTYLLPKGIKSVLCPRLVTHISKKSEAGTSSWRHSYLALSGIMDFEYKVALGDDLIDLVEFEDMVNSGRRLFRFKESFIQLDARNVASILKAKNMRPPVPTNGLELIRDLISNAGSFVKTADAEELIASIRIVEPVVVPLTLHATLRDYQIRGFQWMYNNISKVGGCILADDMGLGKTIQTIALLLHLKEAGEFDKSPALVVCPTSLLSNWMREVNKFAPSMWVKVCDGVHRVRELRSAVGQKRKRASNTPDIVLISYATLRTAVPDLMKVSIPMIVLDEAQNIKNHSSQIAKACKHIGGNALARVALTGTVVENRLAELHSCFDFVLPEYLGKIKCFVDRFSKPIERDRNPEALDLLKRITEPFMLRRLKSDSAIISDLPSKVETKHWISLSKEQAALYESVRSEVFKELAAEPLAGSGIKRSGLVLKLLVALKQICDHPACYENDRRSTEASRSQKCMALLDLLDPIIESGEKVLIFSQYVRMCRILEEQIALKFAVRPLVYEGSLGQRKRDEVLLQFDRNPARQVLILSLRAGGVGLNLT